MMCVFLNYLIIYSHGERIFKFKVKLIRDREKFDAKLVQLVIAQERVLVVHLTCRIRSAQQSEPLAKKRIP